jgi:integrase
MKHATVDENAVIRHLSPDEERRLRKALSDRDDARRAGRVSANAGRRDRGHEPWPEYGTYTDYVTPLVLVALNTGLRRGELLQLQWRDVDLVRRIVTVRGEGAKTGQTRHVPLNSEIASVFKTWKSTEVEPGWFVFSGSTTTTPLTEARKAWRGVLKTARIASFRFHDLRHTFASKLVMAGVDLNTVRELQQIDRHAEAKPRAPLFQARGRRFESCRARQFTALTPSGAGAHNRPDTCHR